MPELEGMGWSAEEAREIRRIPQSVRDLVMDELDRRDFKSKEWI